MSRDVTTTGKRRHASASGATTSGSDGRATGVTTPPAVAVTERGTGSGAAVRFAVRVQPRASRTAVGGAHGGALRVRLLAPPVDGAANDALVEALAESLGVPRRAVRIVAGATSRAKVVEVDAGAAGGAERVAALVRALAAADG